MRASRPPGSSRPPCNNGGNGNGSAIRHPSNLMTSNQLPQFVRDIRPPEGMVLAADHQNSAVPELYGDIEALKLINLEAEGLGEYKLQLEQFLRGKK